MSRSGTWTCYSLHCRLFVMAHVTGLTVENMLAMSDERNEGETKGIRGVSKGFDDRTQNAIDKGFNDSNTILPGMSKIPGSPAFSLVICPSKARQHAVTYIYRKTYIHVID